MYSWFVLLPIEFCCTRSVIMSSGSSPGIASFAWLDCSWGDSCQVCLHLTLLFRICLFQTLQGANLILMIWKVFFLIHLKKGCAHFPQSLFSCQTKLNKSNYSLSSQDSNTIWHFNNQSALFEITSFEI